MFYMDASFMLRVEVTKELTLKLLAAGLFIMILLDDEYPFGLIND